MARYKSKQSRQRRRSGVPAGVNPFCVVSDINIDDGVETLHAPQYFKDGRYGTTAPPRVDSEFLPYEKARELVKTLYDADILDGSWAVKEEFAHIIPKDINPLVTKSQRGRVASDRCYRLG